MSELFRAIGYLPAQASPATRQWQIEQTTDRLTRALKLEQLTAVGEPEVQLDDLADLLSADSEYSIGSVIRITVTVPVERSHP